MTRYAAALALGVALLAGTARAQGAGVSGTPFGVEASPGLAAVRPGDVLPITVVLAIPDGHKIYEDTVAIAAAPGQRFVATEVSRPAPAEMFDKLSDEVRKVYHGRAAFAVEVRLADDAVPARDAYELALAVRFQGCSSSVCYLPETRTVVVRVPVRTDAAPAARVNAEQVVIRASADTASADFTRRSPLVAVLLAFGFGVLLSFTPCVYPLVPVTVAVIGARNAAGGWRRGLLLSLVYVFGLSVTYAGLGVAAATGGASVGAASQHWAVASVVALLFVALALSMLGAYDLELPPSWQKKLRVRRGGGLGVFVMGLVSGLVATPCVAAPLASILVFIATTGSIVLGATMLFAMGWGMGVLLILAGTFTGFASRLPRAGGWMVAVKTGMGVVLLLAALYFARGAVPAGAFSPWLAVPLVAVGIWRGAVVRVAAGAPRAARVAKAAGVTALTLGAYIALGTAVRAGMPAPVVDGLLPDVVLVPHGKIAFDSAYDAALARAKASGVPVMIDFVLPNCAGCRELERHVFSRDDVAAEAARFVTIRVDLASPPRPLDELKETYRIYGAPSVVWVDAAGVVRHDLTVADGATPAEEVLRRMRDVR